MVAESTQVKGHVNMALSVREEIDGNRLEYVIK